MRFQNWRVISKSINYNSFNLTNIEIELEIQIHSVSIHSRKTNASLRKFIIQLENKKNNNNPNIKISSVT